METRPNWVIVVVALGCAGLLILISILVAQAQSRPYSSSVAETDVLTGSQAPTSRTIDSGADWQNALGLLTPKTATSSKDYRAPAELGTTDSISEELVAAYVTLRSENKLGTPAVDAELNEIIRRNVKVIEPKDTYTLASLKTAPATTLEQYGDTIGTIIEKSTSIKEYELAVFAHALRIENHSGTPSLRASASIYRSIERDLVAAPVPTGMEDAHLQMVKSIAFLAQSVELMGDWSGDPIDALAYIDAFVRADRGTKVAFDTLFATVIKVGKKS
jgi:hypothetical protein